MHFHRLHAAALLAAVAHAARYTPAQAPQVHVIRTAPACPRLHDCNPDRHRESWRRTKKRRNR